MSKAKARANERRATSACLDEGMGGSENTVLRVEMGLQKETTIQPKIPHFCTAPLWQKSSPLFSLGPCPRKGCNAHPRDKD